MEIYWNEKGKKVLELALSHKHFIILLIILCPHWQMFFPKIEEQAKTLSSAIMCTPNMFCSWKSIKIKWSFFFFSIIVFPFFWYFGHIMHDIHLYVCQNSAGTITYLRPSKTCPKHSKSCKPAAITIHYVFHCLSEQSCNILLQSPLKLIGFYLVDTFIWSDANKNKEKDQYE